jgi:uncharacterized protein (DUF2252 family)
LTNRRCIANRPLLELKQYHAHTTSMNGHRNSEIVPVDVKSEVGSASLGKQRIGECIRGDATPKAMTGVKLLPKGGAAAAATTSQMGDDASRVMVAGTKVKSQQQQAGDNRCPRLAPHGRPPWPAKVV